ncbi:MAG: hypothetical protein HKO92_04900 [Flavobacteriaceae bacterium]|nr:hypothetical protein [Flavobacteriaceae bacterium]
MHVFYRILNFYLNSSIHVALAIVCLTSLTCLEFEIDINSKLLWFVFFASVTGYNFVKYFGLAKLHHRSLATWLKPIQVFSLFSFVAMIYFGSFLNKRELFLIAGLALLTFLYTIPFFPKNFIKDNIKNLRAISGLKIYIIALVWSVTVVFLPLINANYPVDFDVYLSLFQKFLFVIVIMFPFEIRDLKNDSLKLLTVPQQIGIKRTKQIGVVLLVLLFLLEFFKDLFKAEAIVILGLICIVTLFFLKGSTIYQKKYYSAFWVESIPVIWFGLYLILVK